MDLRTSLAGNRKIIGILITQRIWLLKRCEGSLFYQVLVFCVTCKVWNFRDIFSTIFQLRTIKNSLLLLL